MAKSKKAKAVEPTPAPDLGTIKLGHDTSGGDIKKEESTPEEISQIPSPSETQKTNTVDADESVSGRSGIEEEKVDTEEPELVNPKLDEHNIFINQVMERVSDVSKKIEESKVETIDKKDALFDEEENHDDDPLKVIDHSRVVEELEPGEYTTVGFSKSLEPGTRIGKGESAFVVIQQTAERVSDKGKPYFDHLVMLENSGEDQKSAKHSLFRGTFEVL